MTAAQRRERGTELCRQLTREVAGVVPEGVGRWERAWEIVADPSAEFMAQLTRWEATGSDAAKEPLRAAYLALVAAWKRAGLEYVNRQGAER